MNKKYSLSFVPFLKNDLYGTIIKLNSENLVLSTIDYDLLINRDKNRELFESALKNNIELARECIECGVDINNRQGVDGFTPLIAAAYSGSLDVLKLLINKGADINLCCYKGSSPLMHAMYSYKKNGKKDTFEFLEKKNANQELVDIYQKSIRDYAKEMKIFGII